MAFTAVDYYDRSTEHDSNSNNNSVVGGGTVQQQQPMEIVDDVITTSSNNNDSITEYKNVIHNSTTSSSNNGSSKDQWCGTLLLSSTKMIFQSQNSNNNNNNSNRIEMEWINVMKHQVSPIKYPKALLKIILSGSSSSSQQQQSQSQSSMTFQMENRTVLETIRNDITNRLSLQHHKTNRQNSSSSSSNNNNSNTGTSAITNVKKRSHSNISQSNGNAADTSQQQQLSTTTTTTMDYTTFDPTALAVTRAALLSSNDALRQQHKYLVIDSNTITEEDFWITHEHLLHDEYARINGITKPGTSSLLQSHLPNTGRVVLGVQEMRQIFILYPAVHKAFEEKVPLELSDEQFWKKYLESEYFHRDRGRIGTLARNLAALNNNNNNNTTNDNNNNNKKDDSSTKKQQQQQQQQSDKKGDNNNNTKNAPTLEQQDARAAAIGSDDLFSRYDQKLKEEAGNNIDTNNNDGMNDLEQDDTSSIRTNKHRKWGTKLAIGQFDLASTIETERGTLLEGPKDNYPYYPTDDGKGSRVIQKYNRHWAMVLYPDDAFAGSNLLQVARRSVHDTIMNNNDNDDDLDNDAAVLGGVDTEMRRLVDFANTNEQDANHAYGFGKQCEDDIYEPLTLRNIEAYYTPTITTTGTVDDTNSSSSSSGKVITKERYDEYTQIMKERAKSLLDQIETIESATNGTRRLSETCFPPPSLGRELLSALTKKMAKDSETEAQSIEMANKLPTDLRNQLQSYFRRSSELLRHFFGLRRLFASENSTNNSSSHNGTNGSKIDVSVSNELTSQKLAKIVGGMNTLYREMENMRKTILSTQQSETDEMMRKMCLPIMDQLDWAFKLYYRENHQNNGTTSGSGSSGGFVTVEQI